MTGRRAASHPAASPVVLLWHGRGPDEAHVLRPLAAALERAGPTVLVPNWNSGAPDGGAAALTASLHQAVTLASSHEAVPLVVVGWSLGGTAALSVALDPTTAASVSGVVGLAADVRVSSPVDGTEPLARVSAGVAHEPPPLYLVHGRHDTVGPANGALEFARACQTSGLRCSATLVDSDHAGVVGTRYDGRLGHCVPDDGPAATVGLAAAVDAVRTAAASPYGSRAAGGTDTAIQ